MRYKTKTSHLTAMTDSENRDAADTTLDSKAKYKPMTKSKSQKIF
jgi:hypothetical protein